MSSRTFPPEFVWGSATAAYQIEGAVNEDGRGPSIWDTYSHTPGRVVNGDTGDVADDHYHRWPTDIALMAELGLQAYRFSVVLAADHPRRLRAGEPAGHRLLHAAGRRAAGGRHHARRHALPLGPAAGTGGAGGWPARDTAYRFAEYAARSARGLGDRVDTWTTLNEPWCSAYLGYAAGVHAPGRTEPAAALAAVHHLNLGHGLAAAAIRANWLTPPKISVTHNLHVVRPANPTPRPTSRPSDASTPSANRVVPRPDAGRRVPRGPASPTPPRSPTGPSCRTATPSHRARPMSVLGVNYYKPDLVRHYDGTGERQLADGHGQGAGPWVGAEDVEFLPQPGPYTADGLADRRHRHDRTAAVACAGATRTCR